MKLTSQEEKEMNQHIKQKYLTKPKGKTTNIYGLYWLLGAFK